MTIAIIVFFALIALRFIIYLYRYKRINALYSIYKVYINEPYLEFNEHKPQIIALFKQAGVDDSAISKTIPSGHEQLQTYDLSLFANISNLDTEVVSKTKIKFHESIGIFRHEMIKTVNPISWLEFIFKLPEFLLRYLGVSKENTIIKIFNIIYWICAIIYGLYKVDLLQIFIQNLK